MSSRSLAIPILLIGVGVIFLINNAVPEFSVVQLLSAWWPVILIVFGVIQLIEVMALYGTGRGSTGIRPLGYGWIVMFIIMGIALPHLASHVRWDPSGMKLQLANVFGEEFDFPLNVNTGAGDAKRVVLDRIRGTIALNGADRSDIQMTGHKLIRAEDRNAASKINDTNRVTIDKEGDTIYIRSTDPDDSRFPHVSVDLEISVPKGMNVEARGRSGDLTVASINGDVDIANQHGEVRLQDIGGGAKIDVDHSGLIRATNIKGAVDVEGSGGDVQLELVDGLVTINGQFSGTLDFKELHKALHFESKETDFRVEKLPGTISMSLSELHGTNIAGPIHFVTHERDVNLEDYSGPVDIELGHGDVELKPSAGAALARNDVRSRSGNIEMALPVDKPFDLKATAHQGEVTNDFGDGVISESGPGRTNSLRSANASGPAISLVTDRGEVSVRKLE